MLLVWRVRLQGHMKSFYFVESFHCSALLQDFVDQVSGMMPMPHSSCENELRHCSRTVVTNE